MTKSNLPILIVLVNQTGLIVYGPHLSDVVQVNYPADTVKELELSNSKNIKTMIESLVNEYQVPKSKVVMILDSSVYFEKIIETTDPAEQEKFIDEFKDSVPLESVFVRKFEFNQQIKVIAFNKLFYKSLVRAFNELEFVPKLLVPDFVTSQEVGVSSLTLESAQLLSNSLDKLKNHNLLSPVAGSKTPAVTQTNPPAGGSPTPQVKPNSNQHKPSNNKRTYLLAAAFVLLIAILVWMVITNLM